MRKKVSVNKVPCTVDTKLASSANAMDHNERKANTMITKH